MTTLPPQLKLKLQVYCGAQIAMGPGKADLLEAIDRTGSISAAGRLLGMSYRRAWLLVDTMNRCWDQPLVATRPGGAPGSGAALTESGRRILAHYRGLQQAAAHAAHGADWAALAGALRDSPREG
ncbi:winged helix-turn-helix domain-containing protein [Novosphingobium bradum]|uniref:Winged helix-turn-helix domain-containing protein n=1 Tax=Novosphingobium bradum TaxID=1737444 RepID=A0ABV7IME8_9SPHN